jgi:hypothetical protein
MIDINYIKRKNTILFKSLEDSNLLFLSHPQNYVPIYKRFFSLNETNYNNINLNHSFHIEEILHTVENESNTFLCKISNTNNNEIQKKEIFFKIAPLLDPLKLLVGSLKEEDNIYQLPTIHSNENNCNSKLVDVNNSAFIESFFIYLSSNLLHKYNFFHGIEFYGSFLGIKNNFTINIFDDIDHLVDSEYFMKNKNILFKVDNDEYFQSDIKKKINIENNCSLSNLSICSFHSKNEQDDINDIDDIDKTYIEEIDLNMDNENSIQLNNDSSSCSSRISYDDLKNLSSDEEESDKGSKDKEFGNNDSEEDEEDDEEDDEGDEDESEDEEEEINVTIPKFPVQIISMEKCENTLDYLILSKDISTDEWYSIFMQIIMILITYQKAFSFTHNDLHTNNVMYNTTTKKYIYYLHNKKYYKVPTFGRLFKIIDFGRSIYKYNDNIFCSDSFKRGNDAASQYNCEPYLNNKKPIIEPNFSFDLCRLACSIFDYLVEDLDEINNISRCNDPVKQLIMEWCSDDKGINVLYKSNGAERYPDFKLYKMIARCVHNHTPEKQLERKEFKNFECNKSELKKKNIGLINIDLILI